MAARAYSTGRAPLRTLQAGEIARPFPPIPNLRPWLESRVTQLLDEAERLIGLLDTLDGDCDLEPSLGWSAGDSELGRAATDKLSTAAVDLEDEHDGAERDQDGWTWGRDTPCSPLHLGRRT